MVILNKNINNVTHLGGGYLSNHTTNLKENKYIIIYTEEK